MRGSIETPWVISCHIIRRTLFSQSYNKNMWETSEELAWFYYLYWETTQKQLVGVIDFYMNPPKFYYKYVKPTFPPFPFGPFPHRSGPSGAVIPGRWLALAHRHWRTSSTCSVSISGGKRGNCPQSTDFDPPPRGKGKGFSLYLEDTLGGNLRRKLFFWGGLENGKDPMSTGFLSGVRCMTS